MKPTLYIVRGLPGTGKTTVASKLAPIVCEADQFFMVDDVYQFDRSKLSEAHEDCRQRVRNVITNFCVDCAVANTFTRRWEIQPYIDIAAELDCRVVEITVTSHDSDVELAAKNVHCVPADTIASMRARWEP